MNSRKIIASLAGLLLAAFTITSSVTATAKAATTVPGRATGVASSVGIFNPASPSSWLKPNSPVRPMNSISPDTLYGNYQICDRRSQCINNWNGGGVGTYLRFYQYGQGIANNQWNWWYEGTVSGQQSWPFARGSGVNNAYNGNSVFKFAVAPNGNGKGNCINQNNWGFNSTSAQVITAVCPGANDQTQDYAKWAYFVLDGFDRLVAVKATDMLVAYENNNNVRVYLGQDLNDNNGSYLWLRSSLTGALQWDARP